MISTLPRCDNGETAKRIQPAFYAILADLRIEAEAVLGSGRSFLAAERLAARQVSGAELSRVFRGELEWREKLPGFVAEGLDEAALLSKRWDGFSSIFGPEPFRGEEREAYAEAIEDLATNHPELEYKTPPVQGPCSQAVARAPDERPQIVITARDLAELTAEAWAKFEVMDRNAPTVFRRGGEIVRVVSDDEARIESLSEYRMRHEAVRRLAFKIRKRGEILEDASPKRELIQNMLATPIPPIPELKRIVTGAGIDKTGRVVNHPGFDSDSGFFVVDSIDVPQFTGTAKEAAAWLYYELFSDFPFTSQADHDNALAFLITAAARLLVGRSPIFGAEGPVFGSGKTLLVKTVYASAFGPDQFDLLTIADDEDENRKRLTSVLRTGKPSYLIDNMPVGLEAVSSLAAFVTSDYYSDRLLGVNETVTFKNDLVIAASGNNPSLQGDMVRRYLRIRINPRSENPEQRSGFRHPALLQWVAEHRGEILGAIARILEEWIAAGRPKWSHAPLGSFEEWSSNIGGILESVGITYFLGNMPEVYHLADSQASAWADFVNAWAERYGTADVGAGVLFKIASSIDGFAFRGATEHAQMITFSSALKKQRDRVYGEYQIIFIPSDHHGSLYRLAKITPAPTKADAGDLGGLGGLGGLCTVHDETGVHKENDMYIGAAQKSPELPESPMVSARSSAQPEPPDLAAIRQRVCDALEGGRLDALAPGYIEGLERVARGMADDDETRRASAMLDALERETR